MLLSKDLLRYVLMLTLSGASQSALGSLENLGDFKISSGERIKFQSDCPNSALRGKEKAHVKSDRDDDNGQKKITCADLSGGEAKIQSIRSDWRKIEENFFILAWAYGKLPDHGELPEDGELPKDVSECVVEFEKLYVHLGIRSEELISALSPSSGLKDERTLESSQSLVRAQTTPIREPLGVHFGILDKEITSTGHFSFENTWSDLEKRITKPNKTTNNGEAEFKIQLLESMFMLANYMAKYELIPPEFFEGIRIFQPSFLSELLQFHLRKNQWNPEHVLDDLDWNKVIPTLDCLTSHRMVRPFHGPIRALTHEGQKLIVKDLLKTFMEALKDKHIQGTDDKFDEIFEPFFGKKNTGKDAISSAERIDAGIEEKEIYEIQDQNIPAIFLYVIEQVGKPPEKSEGEKPRNMFLFSCYMSIFLKSFDHHIIADINQGIDLEASERKYQFLHDAFRLLHQTTAQSWHTMKFYFVKRILMEDQDQEMIQWMYKFTELIFDKYQMAGIKLLTEKLKKTPKKSN